VKNSQRGLALIELLLSIALMALLMASVAKTFESANSFERRITSQDESAARHRAFEQTLRTKLSLARLSSNNASTASFFLAGAVFMGGDGQSSNSIAWTADSHPAGALVDSQDDFETSNRTAGPQGGIAEYSISMTPVGNANGKTGLFLRTQIPADGDATQGGVEQLLDPDVEQIWFEFFDGLNWVGAWDTSTMAQKRIPAAVQIHYRLSGDDEEHTILIRLQNSDVTPQNPVAAGGGS